MPLPGEDTSRPCSMVAVSLRAPFYSVLQLVCMLCCLDGRVVGVVRWIVTDNWVLYGTQKGRFARAGLVVWLRGRLQTCRLLWCKPLLFGSVKGAVYWTDRGRIGAEWKSGCCLVRCEEQRLDRDSYCEVKRLLPCACSHNILKGAVFTSCDVNTCT